MPFLEDIADERLPKHNDFVISNDFDQLVRDLSDVLGPTSGLDSADINPQDLIDRMQQYISDEEQWLQFAFADTSRNYTRNLVDEGNGKSNLLIVVWNPGKGSPIHDHADAHCVMKILKGTLEETLYATPEHQEDHTKVPSESQNHESTESISAPLPVCTTTYRENEVTYISDKIGLHKVTNPSLTDVAVSLHLYTPPHAANYGFNLFCEKTGKLTHIKQAGFYSNRGRRVRVGLNGSL